MNEKRRWVWIVLLALSCLACAPAAILREPAASEFFERPGQGVVRVLNWNVKVNSIFPPNGVRHDSFVRIVRAIEPDIIVLQEIFKPGAAREVHALLRASSPGADWATHYVSDNVIASRFEFVRTGGEEVVRHPIPGLGLPEFHYGYATALLRLPPGSDAREILVFGTHNRSRSGAQNMAKRQRHSDAIMRTVRELRQSGSQTDTPFMIVGDLNVLDNPAARDPRQHLATLLTGDIHDEDAYGPDFAPDWDGTALADALPSLNARGQDLYTWRIDSTPFPPGALDRILYTDSVLEVEHAFVLDTTTMTAGELARAGLRREDVLLNAEPGNFDHLPMVVDFVFRSGR